MKQSTWCIVVFLAVCLAAPAAVMAGKGYMGGQGDIVADEPTDDTGNMPDDNEGPLNDKMSDAGKLYGDLYKILRQQGTVGDKKLVPQVDADGKPVTNEDGFQLFVEVVNPATADVIVGGEPVLTVIDPGDTNAYADYGWYAAETGTNPDGTPIYSAAQSPYPALCVQPVASYERWGDISSKTGLTRNRIPMVITYDPTWGRSECEVGQLVYKDNDTADVTVDPATGALTIESNEWFIEPGGTWTDPTNGLVTYPDGVLWTDLIGEVHFGRLNLSRAPEAVLQAAFDEAINTINSPDTIAIEIDAAGRLLLTKNVYDEVMVYTQSDVDDDVTLTQDDLGTPWLLGTIKKAIDSPLENMALYVKLMEDGHLVTPADERMPIDRSLHGGIPLWKMLELEDGPADAALRPTIDIAKMEAWGMDNLVDATDIEDYCTYYQCIDAGGAPVNCLCWNPDPMQPELDGEWVACPDVVDRQLVAEAAGLDNENNPVCAEDTYEGPFTGVLTVDEKETPDATDLGYAASLLAAGADKTGDISVDMVVYLNSILGINQVLGYSEYDDNGEPTADAIDYEKNPEYFNFNAVGGYSRKTTFSGRGEVTTTGGDVDQPGASSYNGRVTVLQGTSPSWSETVVTILEAKYGGFTIFNNIGLGDDSFPNVDQAADNILGFTQQADDNLSVIEFIHTYQIPGRR